MKILHRMVLRMLPGPFLASLLTLMFLLLMQFLIRHLKDLVGRGLPMDAVLELIAYNLAYMVVLAVPMSVLLTVIATFARISETGAYVVIRNAGVSLERLMWPVMVAGGLVMAGMVYFNNITLPDANFRARGLWQDIRAKRPGFALAPGVFYEGLRGYAIRAMRMPAETNDLFDVTIFDYTENSRVRTSINASRGQLETSTNGMRMDLTLFDGEIHRLHVVSPRANLPDRYERLRFRRMRLPLDISDLAFERTDPGASGRSDRTMRTSEMLRLVDSLRAEADEQTAAIRHALTGFLAPDSLRLYLADSAEPLPDLPGTETGERSDTLGGDWSLALAAIDSLVQNRIYDQAMRNARSRQTDLENLQASVGWAVQRADRYMVEVHKKFSIATACLVFVLIGGPLVLLLKRGNIGFIMALSAGIFVFYWVTLVLGEKLSDIGTLRPWVGMWIANFVIAAVAAWLFLVMRRLPTAWSKALGARARRR